MLTDEQKERVELEDKKISDNIHRIKHRLVVFSGKGGVGKTMVSVNLAYGMQRQGNKTGILDADVTGPNVPKMTGANDKLNIENNRIIPQEIRGVKVISMAAMLPPGQAVIWRGPMRSKLLNQFLGDVAWGNLDYLIADLPPGTGDEILTITQKMEPEMAIVVTTPQEVSLIDSARAISMAKKMNIPRITLIENMSGLICPACGKRIDLFGSGGGAKQAEELDVTFLGSIPFDIQARQLADEGNPVILENAKSDISMAILSIVEKIEELIQIEGEAAVI